MKQARGNQYYLDRLARERPDIFRDLRNGTITSIAEALDVSGLKPRRTALQQLQSAWTKADSAEREIFMRAIGCSTAVAPGSTGTNSPSSTVPIHVDRHLTATTIADIRKVMKRRGLKMGDVMDELGLKRLDASLGNALSKGTRVSDVMVERLDVWLSKAGSRGS